VTVVVQVVAGGPPELPALAEEPPLPDALDEAPPAPLEDALPVLAVLVAPLPPQAPATRHATPTPTPGATIRLRNMDPAFTG